MKKNSRKYLILFAFSALCALVVWHGFAIPGQQWQQENIKAPENPSLAQEVAPLQMQWLPGDSFFLTDQNKAVRGLAIGYFLQQKDINGVSLALMHSANVRKSGFSASLVDLSGESNGLAMFVAGGAVRNKGCSIAFWNMAEMNHGVQFGVVNQAQKDLMLEYDMKPKREEKGFGVQAGVVNYSEGNGIQFGLWNTNPNSFLKHFPIINFCF